MRDIEQNEHLSNDKTIDSNTKTTKMIQRNKEHDLLQKESLNKQKNNRLSVTSNIYSLTFDDSLIIAEWDIVNTQTSEKLTDW